MHDKHRVFGNKWLFRKNKRHLFSDKCLLTAENRAHARLGFAQGSVDQAHLRGREGALVRGVARGGEVGHGSHGDRHLGMGASSPKMRIGKRKSAASVSFRLGGAFVRK